MAGTRAVRRQGFALVGRNEAGTAFSGKMIVDPIITSDSQPDRVKILVQVVLGDSAKRVRVS